MPTTPPMSQNQEVIEAKLCAYIDGELDLEGRTEIERHLEANPQHRRLLESLKATKDLVRWLPRDPAPPEVAETLNGQLERSVLLDYDGDSLHPRMWPRILAAAAIVALTVGLAAAVYFALPRSQKNATPYAFHASEQSAGITPLAAVQESVKNADETDSQAAAKPDSPVTDSDATPLKSPPSAIVSKDTPESDLDRLARDVAQNRPLYVAAAGPNQSLSPVAGNAMVMLIHSDAPRQTELQITHFLDAQNVQWKKADAAPELVVSHQSTAAPNGQAISQQLSGSTPIDEWLNRSTSMQTAQAPVAAADGAYYVARMSRSQAQQLNMAMLRQRSQSADSQNAAAGVTSNVNRANPKPGDDAALIGGPVLSPTTAPSEQQSRATAGGSSAAQSLTAPAGSLAPSVIPSTQPAIGSQQASPLTLGKTGEPAATRQMSASEVQGLPATQPATQPAESPALNHTADPAVDVVILVQPNPAANPAPAPRPATTQPASAAESPTLGSQVPATQPAH